jgi:hypothetical protein
VYYVPALGSIQCAKAEEDEANEPARVHGETTGQ